jgi:phenylpyruvate tautomerase PptA (4-oxalocrotonate tautomerase family)
LQAYADINKETVMPLARIDLRKGKDAAYRREIGRVVYEAMIGVGVPQNDRFQVIHEHEADDFLFDADYLGIHRTDDLVIIQITWNEGRTVEQKKALYKAIAEGLKAAIGLRLEDVFINLVEVKKENWSFGNGIAQYAT